MQDDLEQDTVQRLLRERLRKEEAVKKAKCLKQDAAAKKIVSSGKDTTRLEGRGLIEFPPPVAAGYMHKRGESMSSWKRRYFALIDPPEEMGLGAAIYYFATDKELKRMLEVGEQTQKGQLFLEHVKKVSVAQSRQR